MTPSRIEPATSRLVAQCLNQLQYRVPQGRIIDMQHCWTTRFVHFPHSVIAWQTHKDLCSSKYIYIWYTIPGLCTLTLRNLNDIHRLVFAPDTECFLSDVGNELPCVIYINVSLQRFKKTFIPTSTAECMLSKCTQKMVQKGSEHLPENK